MDNRKLVSYIKKDQVYRAIISEPKEKLKCTSYSVAAHLDHAAELAILSSKIKRRLTEQEIADVKGYISMDKDVPLTHAIIDNAKEIEDDKHEDDRFNRMFRGFIYEDDIK